MKATITIAGKKYSAEGATVQEALSSLPYKGFSKLKSILTVVDGKKEKTVVLPPLQTVRLFSNNKMMKDIAVKTLSLKF